MPPKIVGRKNKIGFVTDEEKWFCENIDLIIDTLKSCNQLPQIKFKKIGDHIYKKIRSGYKHHPAYWRAFQLARWSTLN